MIPGLWVATLKLGAQVGEGTKSASDTLQGACSHHGGVDHPLVSKNFVSIMFDHYQSYSLLSGVSVNDKAALFAIGYVYGYPGHRWESLYSARKSKSVL